MAARQLQPSGEGAVLRGNEVVALTQLQREAIESTGARVLESQDGALLLELVDDHGGRIQLALFDAETVSGIEVIGVSFVEVAAVQASPGSTLFDGVRFSPQPVSAHRNGTNHSHWPGYPFTQGTYVYNYANGDSVFHLAAADAGFYQYVAAGWSALLVGLFNPVVGYLTGIFVYGGINNFKNADGSIDLFAPSSSITSHYGNSYYWGNLGGWYYHFPVGDPYYGWARRLSTGVLYRTA